MVTRQEDLPWRWPLEALKLEPEAAYEQSSGRTGNPFGRMWAPCEVASRNANGERGTFSGKVQGRPCEVQKQLEGWELEVTSLCGERNSTTHYSAT